MLASYDTHSSTRIRVLIVDDSVVIRKILADALKDDDAIEVVGTASNGLLALQRIPQVNPDVITLDIEMPEMDGLTTLREIKRLYPRVRVIMCSTLTQRGAGITIEALSMGADDYLTKSSNSAAGESTRLELQQQLRPRIKQFFPSHRLLQSVHAALPTCPIGPSWLPTAIAAKAPLKLGSLPRPKPRAVAVGVSTGGPNALAEVIPALPAHFPLPVFVVQHMPPMFTRLLAERLQSKSKVPVVEAQEGMIANPGSVYIAPGDFHMVAVRKNTSICLHLHQEAPENSCRPAVDVLFRSLADIYGGALVSIILTGMGQDGLRGVQQLRALGSYVIAQDEASSVVWGMPGFVVRAGQADAVCDLRDVVPELLRHV